eukprot:932655-Amphidinium_carterae.1
MATLSRAQGLFYVKASCEERRDCFLSDQPLMDRLSGTTSVIMGNNILVKRGPVLSFGNSWR